MKKSASRKKDPIVIDNHKNLVFNSEEELYDHFSEDIEKFEEEYQSRRTEGDFTLEELSNHDDRLSDLLDDPDEVWKKNEIFTYIKQFEEDPMVWHLAICYLTEETPSFIYLHFPTRDPLLVEQYREEQMIYDRSKREVPIGAMEGDALYEGDPLAGGLYKAMMMIRAKKDINEDQFVDFHECRETSVEDPDEIWRHTDPQGYVLVTFIKEFEAPEGQNYFYIVVTLEDEASNSHSLLFSFPTKDGSLVGRYRHGENLQADEIVQESSH